MKPPDFSASSPLRVLVVTARYLPSIGGTEIHTFETARRIAADGHQITVLTTRLDKSLPTSEENERVRIIRVPYWPEERDYFFAPAMVQIVRDGCWDLLHCQGTHTLVPPLAMLAARSRKLPYVATFHSGGSSSRVRSKLRRFQHRALRALLAGAERLICVSEFEAKHFQRRLRIDASRFVVIPNGAELPEVETPAAPQPDCRLIVSLGRLERYKGHHRVIQALPYVLEKMPDVNLRVTGSGPYEQDLRQMATDLGVANHVEIREVPAGDRHAMASLLARASLVTLLSEYESQGIAVTEAIQLKRPVLVADTSALHDIAALGLAREVSLESSPREVAAAMLRQLEKPLIPPEVTVPSWDDCAAKLLDVYQSVVRSQTCVS